MLSPSLPDPQLAVSANPGLPYHDFYSNLIRSHVVNQTSNSQSVLAVPALRQCRDGVGVLSYCIKEWAASSYQVLWVVVGSQFAAVRTKLRPQAQVCMK